MGGGFYSNQQALRYAGYTQLVDPIVLHQHREHRAAIFMLALINKDLSWVIDRNGIHFDKLLKLGHWSSGERAAIQIGAALFYWDWSGLEGDPFSELGDWMEAGLEAMKMRYIGTQQGSSAF